MIYGYCRVSTKDQNLERQIKAMLDFGVEEKNIITDKQSGKDFNRKGFNLLVGTDKTAAMLRKGDLLVVYSLDRLGRNYDEIHRMWQHIINGIEADIKVLDLPLLDTRMDETDLDKRFIADLVLQILSYCSEKERSNIRLRQAEGYAAMQTDAKGRKISSKTGRHIGRQEIQKPENFDKVVSDWENGEITAVEAMRRTGLKKNTFYKMVSQSKKDFKHLR